MTFSIFKMFSYAFVLLNSIILMYIYIHATSGQFHFLCLYVYNHSDNLFSSNVNFLKISISSISNLRYSPPFSTWVDHWYKLPVSQPYLACLFIQPATCYNFTARNLNRLRAIIWNWRTITVARNPRWSLILLRVAEPLSNGLDHGNGARDPDQEPIANPDRILS